MCAQIFIVLVVRLIVDRLQVIDLIRQPPDLLLNLLLCLLRRDRRRAGKYSDHIVVIISVDQIVLVERAVFYVFHQKQIILCRPVHGIPVAVLIPVPVVIDVRQYIVLQETAFVFTLCSIPGDRLRAGRELSHGIFIGSDDPAYLLDLKRSGIVGDFQIVVAVPVFVQKHVTVFGDPPFQNLGKQFLHLHIPDEFELIQ